ncbi:hypothetical protein FQR65_LT02307 [Abscondita terminalis]|nr:hypothetical protein FQR65_LT02307 [Abscondita terminalis]
MEAEVIIRNKIQEILENSNIKHTEQSNSQDEKKKVPPRKLRKKSEDGSLESDEMTSEKRRQSNFVEVEEEKNLIRMVKEDDLVLMQNWFFALTPHSHIPLFAYHTQMFATKHRSSVVCTQTMKPMLALDLSEFPLIIFNMDQEDENTVPIKPSPQAKKSQPEKHKGNVEKRAMYVS